MKLSDFLNKETTEIQQKKKQQKEYKLIGSMNHKKGLTLFSINTITGEIKPAEYIKESVITWEQALLLIHGKGGIARKVMVEKDCVYIEALNAENAKKKYNTRKSRRNRYEDRKD